MSRGVGGNRGGFRPPPLEEEHAKPGAAWGKIGRQRTPGSLQRLLGLGGKPSALGQIGRKVGQNDVLELGKQGEGNDRMMVELIVEPASLGECRAGLIGRPSSACAIARP